MITINTQLTQQQIDQVKKIIGKHHGHTYYNDVHHFFTFDSDNIYKVFSQIQDLGLQAIIGWTYYRDDKDDNAMIQFAVIPQQIKV